MRLGEGRQVLPSVERGLLHLNADETGLQQHLLRVDFRDVELLRRALAVEELEHLEWRAVALRVAHVGVDVGEREVRLPLGERVEGDALGQDLAHELVVALELGLLVGVHRVAEEHPGALRAVLALLDARGVGELRAAVGEDDREEPREELVPELRVESVERGDDAGRALVGDEDADHEARPEPVERHEADAAGASDEEVHVDGPDAGMLREESPVVAVGAAHVAAGLDLVLVLAREGLARADHARALEVAALRGEDAVVDVALDGALVARQLRLAGDADVVDGLPRPDLRGHDSVDELALPRLEGRALPALAQDPAVVLVRVCGDVEELAPVASPLVGAAVAHLGRAQEALRAVDVLDLPAEPVAVAVAAPGAWRALGGAVSADPGEFAVLPADALVRAPVAPLEGLVGVFADLPRDGRQAHADLLRDGPCGLLGREAELDAAPLGAVHLLLSFFHLVIPLLPPPRLAER